jgi:predicted amidohydrolase YtcJ
MEGLDPLREEILRTTAPQLRALLEEWARLGVLRVAAMSVAPDEASTLAALARERPLPVQVDLYLRLRDWTEGIGPALGLPAPGIELTGVKAHLDGSLGARTAWLGAPYADRPSEAGAPGFRTEGLLERLAPPRAAGAAVALHAIGDRALDQALTVFERLPPGPGRLRIEHASVVPPGDRARVARSGAWVAVQPSFRVSDGWIGARLGRPRLGWAYPFRQLADLGVPLLGSSDAPVETIDPWAAMRAAVETPVGFLQAGSVRPDEALRMYIGGLRRPGDAHAERLRPGDRSDLIVAEGRSLEELLRARAPPVRGVWRGGLPLGPGTPRSP